MNKSKVDFMKVLVSALFFEKSSSGDNPLGDIVSLKNRKFFEMSLKSQNWFIGNNVSTYYYYYYHFVVLQKPTPSKYFGSSLFLFFCGIWSCMQNSWWVIHLASSCSRSQLVTWSLSLMESFFNCRQSQLKASAQIQHYWQASNFACMLFTLSNVPSAQRYTLRSSILKSLHSHILSRCRIWDAGWSRPFHFLRRRRKTVDGIALSTWTS